MDSTEQSSDKLLHEIIQLEVEIDKIMALNNNHENRLVKQYRRYIVAKCNKLNQLNNNYREQD